MMMMMMRPVHMLMFLPDGPWAALVTLLPLARTCHSLGDILTQAIVTFSWSALSLLALVSLERTIYLCNNEQLCWVGSTLRMMVLAGRCSISSSSTFRSASRALSCGEDLLSGSALRALVTASALVTC